MTTTLPTCAQCGAAFREKSPDCGRHAIYEERAAILEHDAKLPRAEAERRAVLELTQAVGK